MYKQRTTKKGFTLIELMVSIFIFLLMMLAIITVFGRHVAVYKHNRVLQRNVENAQFAMNFIAKTLRTSSVVGIYNTPSTNRVDAYDFSVQRCYRFEFTNGGPNPTIQMTEAGESVPIIDPQFCDDNSTYSGISPISLTTGQVRGQFNVVASQRPDPTALPSPLPAVIGRVTMSVEVVSGDGDSSQTPIYLQTSVSLRDYPAELSF